MALPKLFVTDIDGVWTDGGMYYDQSGNEWKKFNTSDSAGVLFGRVLGIPTAIITGERTKIVARRAAKLKIVDLHQGIQDKKAVALKLAAKYDISLEDMAYIGDDIGDLELLQLVGWSAAPANAPQYIKDKVQYVTQTPGGQGAFREFVEWMITQEMPMEDVLEKLANRA